MVIRQLQFDSWSAVFGLFALGNLGLGIWMLADPTGWYYGVPGAVPDFGPLNTHFVRDVGAAFVMAAVSLLFAAVRPDVRVPAMVIVSVFYVLHATVHVIETVTGTVDSAHWLIDLPGVYGPAALVLAVTVVVARQKSATS